MWQKRRLRAQERGEHLSGEYDDEVDSDDFGTLGNNADTIDHGLHGAKIKSRVMGKRNQVSVDDGQSGHPPCPDGFDPNKWAKMTLEQKCKHLGIDYKEWLKMNREQQMQRMHNLANNFKFYAFDKIAPNDEATTNRKKWHL